MSGLNLDNVTPQKFQVDAKARMAMFGLIIVGALALLGGFMVDRERAWHAYLVGFFFVTSLGMGGLFFTAIQHVSAAGWSTNIRRFAEAMAAFVPMIFILGLPIVLFAKSDLYLWLNAGEVAKDPILLGKAGYLNHTFFIIRFVLFSAAWFWFGRKLIGFSLAQDNDGKDQWTTIAVKWSVAFLLVFALSFSFFSVDFLMSLEPHWFSTIYGVYCFAGMFQAALAVLILMSLFVMKMGWSNGLVNDTTTSRSTWSCSSIAQ